MNGACAFREDSAGLLDGQRGQGQAISAGEKEETRNVKIAMTPMGRPGVGASRTAEAAPTSSSWAQRCAQVPVPAVRGTSLRSPGIFHARKSQG